MAVPPAEVATVEAQAELVEHSWSGFEYARSDHTDLSRAHELMRVGRSEDGTEVDFYRIGSDGKDGFLGEIDPLITAKREKIYRVVNAVSRLDALLIPDIYPMALHRKSTGDWEPDIGLTEFDEEQADIRELIKMRAINGMRHAVAHRMIRQAWPADLEDLNEYLQEDQSLSVALRKIDNKAPHEFQTVARLVGLGAAIKCVQDPKVPPIHFVRPVLLLENKFHAAGLQPADAAVVDLYHRHSPQRVVRKEEIEES